MKQLAIGFTLCMSCAAFADKPRPVLEVPQRVSPVSMARARVINGNPFTGVEIVGDWIPYNEGAAGQSGGGIAGGCEAITYDTCPDYDHTIVFDEFEPTSPASGVPGDGECGFGGGRYNGGATYNQGGYINDMEICVSNTAQFADGMDHVWRWGGTAARPCFIGIFTANGFSDTCTDPAATGVYAFGVVLNYGSLPPGFWYSNVSYCGAVDNELPYPPSGNSIDNKGAVIYIMSNVSNLATRDTTPGTNAGLWSTRTGVRPGTSLELEYDDDAPNNGTYTAATECYTYAGAAACPAEPLGGCLDFRVAPSSACEPCDTNCDGTINLFDIDPFVAQLSPNPPAPCSACAADTNSDGTINLFDIDPFVTCLGG